MGWVKQEADDGSRLQSDSLEAWERKLNSIITGTKSNVVNIDSARKVA